ncbi:MAG: ATP-binding protein [Acidimicrobiales bacterium]
MEHQLDTWSAASDAGAAYGDGSGTARAECRLAGDARSIGMARSVVEDLLADRDPDVRDDAVLLTDELVTNALVHGGGRFSLAVDVGADTLRVEVGDRSPDVPRVLRPAGDREHGRGMAIVDALATTWGTDREEDRKVVWFELSLHVAGGR